MEVVTLESKKDPFDRELKEIVSAFTGYEFKPDDKFTFNEVVQLIKEAKSEMAEQELTVEILDKAIAYVKMYRDRTPIEFRLNPTDWRKAKAALRTLSKFVGVNVKVAEESMWGIKVVEEPDLPEGTMLMVYDKECIVKVEYIGIG